MLSMRSMLVNCLFLATGVVLVVSQDPPTSAQWSGCVQSGFGMEDKVRIGELTRVCLQVGDSVSWVNGVKYVRASFLPQADEYSRFYIPNSFNDLVLSSAGSIFEKKNVTVGVASQQQLSFLRLYYNVDLQRVYPYLTAIMDVRDGVVRGITWDNACVFCGGFVDECEENTYSFTGTLQTQETSGQETKSCYKSVSACTEATKSKDEEAKRLCDITLYVAWSGTDVDGKALQSQAYRFSEFPVQALSDRITQLIPDLGVPELLEGEGNNTQKQ